MIHSIICPINQVKKIILIAVPNFYECSKKVQKLIVEDYVKPVDVQTVLDFMAIKKISSKEALNIIEYRKPIGKFYLKEDKVHIGIDNIRGDAWTEEFESEEDCLEWLMGWEDNE